MVYKMKPSLRVLDLVLVFRNVLGKIDWDFVLTKSIIMNFNKLKLLLKLWLEIIKCQNQISQTSQWHQSLH